MRQDVGDTFRSSSGSIYKSTGLARRARINLAFLWAVSTVR